MKIDKLKIINLLLLVCVTAFVQSSIYPDNSSSAQDKSVESNFHSFDLNKINTTGWSDSPYVTGDGKYLFFMYSRYNFMPTILLNLPPKLSGGIREGHKINDINPYDDSDIYVSERNQDGSWGIPKAMKNLNDHSGDCCMVFSQDLKLVFYAKHSDKTNSQDIAFRVREDNLPISVSKWGKLNFLGQAVNSNSHEDNPHICAYSDGSVSLWFTSWRKEGKGGKDIWLSEYKDNTWSEAINLGNPINTSKNEDQFFINCRTKEAYFNRNDSIMRSKYLGSGKGYSEPEPIDVGFVFAAEASLTDDGREMYFASGNIKEMNIKVMKSVIQKDGSWSTGKPVD